MSRLKVMTARPPRTQRSTLLRSGVAMVAIVASLAPSPAAAQTPELRLAPVSPLTPEVDANDAGQAAVAWSRPDGVRVLTTNRASGATTAGAVAATTEVNGLQVAVDDAGAVVVVWENLRRRSGYKGETRWVSDGVYAAIGQVGVGMRPAVRVVGPRPDTGRSFDAADPQLATDHTGRAVIAGSDASGAWVSTRRSGEPFGAPERAADGVTVTGAALGGDGEVLLSDVRSRVITGRAGAPFSAPVPLPQADTPYGPGAIVAANAAGDAVALYRNQASVLTSRRAPDGTWGSPEALSTVPGASARDLEMSGDGTAVATFAQTDFDPRARGTRSALRAATLTPDGPPSVQQLGPPDLDVEAPRGALDADANGRFSVAYDQRSLYSAPGDALVTVRPAGGAFAAPTVLSAGGLQLGNVSRVALVSGGALAAFTEREDGEDRLVARWLPDGPSATLDRVRGFDRTLPVLRPHTLQITTQPTRRPDRRGRILLGLRCFSTARSDCRGTVRLTAEPSHWTAARARYAIAANKVHLTRPQLSRRALRALRRQGRLTLTAAGVAGKLVVRPQRRSRPRR